MAWNFGFGGASQPQYTSRDDIFGQSNSQPYASGASQFGWSMMPNGNFKKGNQVMTADEMAGQLPRWQSIVDNSNSANYNSGVNYLASVSQYINPSNQPNEYESQLKSLMANPDSIKDTGAYKFAFDQGQQAVERSAAAKGMLGSGNVLAELAQFGQGIASQQYNNEANRLMNMAGTQKNYLLNQGQLALGAAKAQGDDYWTGKQLANQFSLSSGYGKQSLW